MHSFTKLKSTAGFIDYLIIGIECSRSQDHTVINSVIESIDRYSIIHLRSVSGKLRKIEDITEFEGCDIFATILEHYDIGRNTIIICNNSLVFLGSSDLIGVLDNEIYTVGKSSIASTDIQEEDEGEVSQSVFIASAPPTVVCLESPRNKSKITIVDIANYGIKSIGHFFNTHNIDYTSEYKHYEGIPLSMQTCEGCCIGMYFVVKKLHELVRIHKLGGFSVTYASQGMRAFRAGHYNESIVKHGDENAATIEEGCYYGGRSEDRYNGWYRGKCYMVDLQSLYPSVGRNRPFPIRLLESFHRPKTKNVASIVGDSCGFAHVRVNTQEPLYPCKIDGQTKYPVGEFNTYLCSDELTEAIGRDDIVECYYLCTYATGMVLKSYSDYMLELRSKYKRNGDKVAETLIKYITNGIWGKFAQIGSRWIVDGTKVHTSMYGGFTEVDLNNFGEVHWRVINGECSKLCRAFWADNTYMPITASMNSICRMLLWRYMQFAGLSNVLYCSIDGFILTEQGYNNLKPFITDNPHAYGQFKLTHSANECYIHSIGKYRIADKVAMSGVPTDDMYRYRGFWAAKNEAGIISAEDGHARAILSGHIKPSELRDNLGRDDFNDGSFTSPVFHSDDVILHAHQYSRRANQKFWIDEYLK